MLPFVLVLDNVQQFGPFCARVGLVWTALGVVLGPQEAKLVVGHARVGQLDAEPSQWFGEHINGVQNVESVPVQQFANGQLLDQRFAVRHEQQVDKAKGHGHDGERPGNILQQTVHQVGHGLVTREP